jgi:hypothetical protein
MTQTERVIKAARSFRGTSQTDWLAPTICDGGKPITRLAARIFDAEQQGYTFEVIGWRHHCKVYRLASVPEGTAPAPQHPITEAAQTVRDLATQAAEAAEPTLFDPEPRTGSSHYEDAA